MIEMAPSNVLRFHKLASYHLLLYVVYTCQKSFNLINAFLLVTSENVSWPRLVWPTL